MEGVLGFVLIALVVVGLVYAAHLSAKRRREAMAALAQELNARFDPEPDRDHDNRYSQFTLFRTGSGRTAYNTIRGETDLGAWRAGFTMGDYKYTVQQGKSTVTYNVGYLLLHLPFAGVPDLSIRREGLFDKIAGAVGFEDIDFESAEFSGRFHVKSSDKKFAYDVIHPMMMEFLMAVEPPPIELNGGSLLIARGTSRWDPQDYRDHLEWARLFFQRWPDHLLKRLSA